MAQVSFLPDQQAPPIDKTLIDLAGQAALLSKPLRVRVQPDIYSVDKQEYVAWKGLVWALDLDDAAEGTELRVVLQQVLGAFGDPEKKAKLLTLLGEL